jgi:hypothetical protein
MRAFQIQDVKIFMSHLLLSNTFDRFLIQEAAITTFCTFQIDGHQNADYFSDVDQKSDPAAIQDYIFWKQVRPFCFSLIKGKKTPSHMHLVFALSPANLQKLLEQNGLSLSRQDIGGLYLNIRYDGRQLLATTGTSLHLFTLDKTLEHLWDSLITSFFKKHQIPFLIA